MTIFIKGEDTGIDNHHTALPQLHLLRAARKRCVEARKLLGMWLLTAFNGRTVELTNRASNPVLNVSGQ